MLERKPAPAATLTSAIPRRPKGTSPCAACQVRETAVCAALNPMELQRFSDDVTVLTISAGSPLVDEGEDETFVFSVTAGCLKIYKLMADGRRQITGFLFAGDFLGLARSNTYTCSAEAVSSTTLCRMTRKQFDGFARSMPNLERRLFTFASEQIAEVQEQLLLLGRKTAQERVATFLLKLSERTAQAGRPAEIVDVPMSRDDIADYLGLTTETVSRTFSKLRKAKLISSDKDKKIRLFDVAGLADMAGNA